MAAGPAIQRAASWCSFNGPSSQAFTVIALGCAAGLGWGEALFLPTGYLALLETLNAARPAHTLVAADFDALPETVIPGAGAPLVATTVRRIKNPVLRFMCFVRPRLQTRQASLVHS